MSFATRCTACGTIFRVVQDQLRVSEGWVRCGRCAEVFDAREQLFDIDRDAPPVWAGDAAATTSAQVQDPDPEVSFRHAAAAADDELENPVPQPAPAPMTAAVDPRTRQEPQWEDEATSSEESWRVPAAAEPGLETTDADAAVIDALTSAHLAESATVSIAAASTASAELPSFMRPTPAAASRWQRPGTRLAMAGLTLLLLVALAAQLLLHFRDAIAAVYPQALPSLQALCQTGGCKVQAWRRIEALSVENSALTQAGGDSGSSGSATNNRYQLTLSLHNKSGVPVATPSIELSLLNPSGAVVLRRVLSPNDFRQDRSNTASPSAIAPGADVPMQLQLTTGAQRISGYSVEIFHP